VGGGEEPVANSATVKGSMVVLGMSICVKQELVRGQGRKAAWRGEARKVFGMWIAASCGNRDQDRWGTELDLGGSQSLDDHHRSTTVRAQLAIARGMIRGCFGLSWRY